MQIDGDCDQAMQDPTPREQTPSPGFPLNQLAVGKKHPLGADDDDMERPAKRRSQTPNTTHPTPAEKEVIRGFDPKLAVLPPKRK